MSSRHDDGSDLLADRRLAWARALEADGELAAAADLLEQGVGRAPGWAPGWAALAEARGRLGRADSLAAWEQCLRLDPGDRFGAALHIARLRGTVPGSMPDAYVRALFDGYAPRFEQHLVEGLDYRGPEVVRAALDRQAANRRFRRALDLGCGTGLMGRAVRGRVDAVDGVDLSPRMIDRARSTGLYADLFTGPLDRAFTRPAAYDLVLAADVLAYLGALEPVMTAAAGGLEPGGLFVFTLQRSGSDGEVELGPDLRFAHGRAYVETVVVAAGLILLSLDDAPVRREHDRPVPGLVGVARRPEAA